VTARFLEYLCALETFNFDIVQVVEEYVFIFIICVIANHFIDASLPQILINCISFTEAGILFSEIAHWSMKAVKPISYTILSLHLSWASQALKREDTRYKCSIFAQGMLVFEQRLNQGEV
jgi:hypothetical protein